MIRYTTISDAWFHCLKLVMSVEAYRQDIECGSFAGESYRLQLPYTAFSIVNPLADYIPSVPDSVPQPVTLEYVKDYFLKYIIGTEPACSNETYNYSDRITDQLPDLMDMLSKTPFTNQATISVSMPSDFGTDDPPCLREIDFKAYDGKLDVAVFFRSNDLWAAFPANLAAIGMLQEFVAEWIGCEVGMLHYASAGLHIYSYQADLVKQKLNIR